MNKESQSVVAVLIAVVIAFTAFCVPIMSSAAGEMGDSSTTTTKTTTTGWYGETTAAAEQTTYPTTTAAPTTTAISRKPVSGVCGSNLTWTLDFATCTLIISGTGTMDNYSLSSASPWYIYQSDVKSVVIEESVTSIGDYAFYGCSKLTSAYYPGTLEQWLKVSVGKNNSLFIDSLIIESDSVRPIYLGGFCGDNVTYVLYADGELVISGNGDMQNFNWYSDAPWYSKASKIIRVTIGNKVTSIGNCAFGDCSNLINITIGSSVKSIGSYAFYECTNLTNVIIPDNITSICNNAFEYCTKLTKVVIGNGVTNIGNYAFWNCSKLASLTIGNSITNIGFAVFGGCTGLTRVIIPDSVKTISSYAFMSCYNLTSIAIPKSVTYIDAYAFDGCKKINSVYFSGKEVDWGAIGFGYNNNELLNATIYFETTAEDIPVEETTTRTNETITAYHGWFTKPGGTTTIAAETTTKAAETTTKAPVTTKVIQNNKSNIKIAYSSTTVINYGETIILHAQVQDMPEKGMVEWSVIGNGVVINPSEDGMTCRVTSVSNGSVIVTAKVVDAKGEVCTDANGYEVSDSRQLTSKAGFWEKFISFFKNLFRISRIILQSK